jgi:hypothetical protein
MTSMASRWNCSKSVPCVQAGRKLSNLASAVALTSMLGAFCFAASSVIFAPSAEGAALECFKRLGRDGNYLVCCPKYFPSPDCVVIKIPSRLLKSDASAPSDRKAWVTKPKNVMAAAANDAPACPGGGTEKCTITCTGLLPPVCTSGPPCTCTLDKATAGVKALLSGDAAPPKPNPPRPLGDLGRPANILEGGSSFPPGGGPAPTGAPAAPAAPAAGRIN